MVDQVYIVQGFGPAPESPPLTVPARFATEAEAQRHARVIGTFCCEVRLQCCAEAAPVACPESGQEKARTGNPGF